MSDHDLYNLLADSSSNAFLNFIHKVLHSVHLIRDIVMFSKHLFFVIIEEYMWYSVLIKISIFENLNRILNVSFSVSVPQPNRRFSANLLYVMQVHVIYSQSLISFWLQDTNE